MESVESLRPTTLIVGASGDLLEVGRVLGRQGERIGLLSRNTRVLHQFKERLLDWGVDAEIFMADVTDSQRVLEAFMQFSVWSKRLDRLIYNVGVLSTEPASEVTESELARVMGANFFGFVNCFQLAQPMFQRFGSGHVIAMSGTDAIVLENSPVAYATSKASLRIYIQALRGELEEKGILFSELFLGQMRDGFDLRELTCEEIVTGVLQVIESKLPRHVIGNAHSGTK